MRRWSHSFSSRLVLAAVVTCALVATSAGIPASGTALDETRVRAALRHAVADHLTVAASGVQGSGRTRGTPAAGLHTRLVGSARVPGGLNGDVYSYHGFAYVGTWSGPCPGTGVKIFDVSEPDHPVRIAAAAAYPNTSAEDMQVLTVDTAGFSGDLLAIGLQDCGLPDQPSGMAGLDLWDVTDPGHPTHLGFYDTFDISDGVHEVALIERSIAGQSRVFALTAQPFAEVFSTLFTPTPTGDFQLLDVTDPANPVLADDWGASKDGGLAAGSPDFGLPAPFDCTPPPGTPELCRGHSAAVFGHSATPSLDGKTAFVAYWDAGAVALDMTDPTDLTMIGRTSYPAGSEGDTHSAVPNAAGTLLATTDEDFSPSERAAAGEPKLRGDTWGFARLWDITDPGAITHLSNVTTPHSLTGRTDAFYSAHNPEFVGDRLTVSWYSDGLRVFDVSNPMEPRQVAAYRPRPTRDPTGVFTEFGAKDKPYPFVWGAHNEGGLTYLSDINYGLYVVQIR